MPAAGGALLVVEGGVRREGVPADAAGDVAGDGVDLCVGHLVRGAGDVAEDDDVGLVVGEELEGE